MKNALRLFFLAITCAVPICEAAYTTTPDVQNEHQNATTSTKQVEHDRAAKKNHARGSSTVAKPNHPQPRPKNEKHLAPGKLADARRSVAGRSAALPSGTATANKTASKARSAQLPTTSRTSAPTLSIVRHRNPNPAIVGGSKSSTAVSTGAINGTRMSRKP